MVAMEGENGDVARDEKLRQERLQKLEKRWKEKERKLNAEIEEQRNDLEVRKRVSLQIAKDKHKKSLNTFKASEKLNELQRKLDAQLCDRDYEKALTTKEQAKELEKQEKENWTGNCNTDLESHLSIIQTKFEEDLVEADSDAERKRSKFLRAKEVEKDNIDNPPAASSGNSAQRVVPSAGLQSDPSRLSLIGIRQSTPVSQAGNRETSFAASTPDVENSRVSSVCALSGEDDGEEHVLSPSSFLRRSNTGPNAARFTRAANTPDIAKSSARWDLAASGPRENRREKVLKAAEWYLGQTSAGAQTDPPQAARILFNPLPSFANSDFVPAPTPPPQSQSHAKPASEFKSQAEAGPGPAGSVSASASEPRRNVTFAPAFAPISFSPLTSPELESPPPPASGTVPPALPAGHRHAESPGFSDSFKFDSPAFLSPLSTCPASGPGPPGAPLNTPSSSFKTPKPLRLGEPPVFSSADSARLTLAIPAPVPTPTVLRHGTGPGQPSRPAAMPAEFQVEGEGLLSVAASSPETCLSGGSTVSSAPVSSGYVTVGPLSSAYSAVSDADATGTPPGLIYNYNLNTGPSWPVPLPAVNSAVASPSLRTEPEASSDWYHHEPGPLALAASGPGQGPSMPRKFNFAPSPAGELESESEHYQWQETRGMSNGAQGTLWVGESGHHHPNHDHPHHQWHHPQNHHHPNYHHHQDHNYPGHHQHHHPDHHHDPSHYQDSTGVVITQAGPGTSASGSGSGMMVMDSELERGPQAGHQGQHWQATAEERVAESDIEMSAVGVSLGGAR